MSRVRRSRTAQLLAPLCAAHGAVEDQRIVGEGLAEAGEQVVEEAAAPLGLGAGGDRGGEHLLQLGGGRGDAGAPDLGAGEERVVEGGAEVGAGAESVEGEQLFGVGELGDAAGEESSKKVR